MQDKLIFPHIHILALSSLPFAPSQPLQALQSRDVILQGASRGASLALDVGYFPGESRRSRRSPLQAALRSARSAGSQGDIVS